MVPLMTAAPVTFDSVSTFTGAVESAPAVTYHVLPGLLV
jgi:hypothetical protein